MAGMKEKLGDKYPAWYARHRIVEQQRIWKLVMEENPMKLIPDYQREMPSTYELDEAFYHYPGCPCGSCIGAIGKLAKVLHVERFKDLPFIRGAASPIPELPDQIQLLLQAVEEAALSLQDRQEAPQSE